MNLKKILILINFLYPLTVIGQPWQISLQSFVAPNNIHFGDDQKYAIHLDYKFYKSLELRLSYAELNCKLTSFYVYDYFNPGIGNYWAQILEMGIFLKYDHKLFQPHFGFGLGYYFSHRSLDRSTYLRLSQIGYTDVNEKLKNAFSPYVQLGLKTPIYKNIFYMVDIKYIFMRIISNRKYTAFDGNTLYYSSHQDFKVVFYGLGLGIKF